MYRIAAMDLDGTLLRDDKTISQYTVDVLKKISDQGVIILPSTGRTHKELPQPVKELPFIRYALCCNGGALYDYQQEKYILENAIPYELACKVLDYVKQLPVYESVVVNGGRYAKAKENGELNDYVSEKAVKGILFNFTPVKDVHDAFVEMHKDAQKILLYLDVERGNKEEVMNDLKAKYPQLAISSSGPLYIEVNVQGIDKGKALNKFCEILDIPITETLAFGDAENDIAMLDEADKAIVVDNGNDATKAHADIICESNNDDGVAKELARIFLEA